MADRHALVRPLRAFAQACLLAILTLSTLPATPPGAPRGGPSAPYVPGEMIVKFKGNAPPADRALARAEVAASRKRRFRSGAEHWKLGAGVATEQAIERLRRNPRVEFAEPNYIVRLDVIPDDPLYAQLYALNNAGQTGGIPGADIDAEKAWEITTGSRDVVVGVIDTGIDYNHRDLAANIWTNPGEIGGNAVDDDGNGYLDDVHGWDFVNNDNDPLDDQSHGTHVAGTIGAVGNNGVGVVGVNWHVSMMALKFLDSTGRGTVGDAIAAIDYATQMGADLTSNSWGGGGFSQALVEAIRAAGAADILFVAAAGNSAFDNDILPTYPASHDLPNIISVAATDDQDLLATFSNYGARTVDIGAPGVGILSTVPGGGYGSKSGTSMATPHVAGVAALLRAIAPAIPATTLKQTIMDLGDPLPSLAGITVSGKRLNAALAVSGPDRVPPGAIGDLAVVAPTSNTIYLGWTATGDDGSSGAASSYDVRHSTSPIDEASFGTASRAAGAPIPSPSGAAETMEVKGLIAATTYYFAVRAIDEWGNAGEIGNVAEGTTLPPPTVATSPASFTASLFTGQVATRTLTIENAGDGTLDWLIPAPAVSGVAAAEPPDPLVLPGGEEDPRAGAPVVQGTGGPDAFGYRFVDSDEPGGPVFAWNDISLTGTPIASLNGDDQTSELIPLAFDFPFYGNTFSAVRVNTNGWISFTSTSTTSSHQPLPSSTAPENLIAPLWDDLDFLGANRASYAREPGVFIVQYTDVPRFSGPGTYTFQAILKDTGEILFQYLALSGIVEQCTVGIQDATKTVGLQAVFNSSYLHHHLAVLLAAEPQWLSADPSAGRLGTSQRQDVTIGIDSRGLHGGTYRGTVHVASNDPSSPVVAHPVTLEVADAPAIEVEPSSLEFGTVFAGFSAVLPLTVRNMGTMILTATLSAGDPAVSVSPSSVTVAPARSQTVSVTFAPSSPGALSAMVVVESDAPNAPRVEIPATGLSAPSPGLQASPSSFSETLPNGATVTRKLRVGNSGGSDLLVSLAAELVPASAPAAGSVAGGTGQDPPAREGTGIQIVPAPTFANGGFETGTFSGWIATSNGRRDVYPWTVSSAGGGIFYNSNPAEGRFDALNGFEGEAGLEYTLSHEIVIPPGTIRAELSYYDRIQFDSGGRSSTLPKIYEATIQDTSGAILAVAVHEEILLSGRPYTDLGWRRRSADLTPFAGRTVRLHIRQFVPESYTGLATIEFDAFSIDAEVLPDWLAVAPASGVIPPGGYQEFDVLFSPGDADAGLFSGSVRIDTNIPGAGSVRVPALLNVIGAPNLDIAGGPVTIESLKTYGTPGAGTSHALPITVPPSGGGDLEISVDGDYGDSNETALATAEGTTLGTLGGTGSDCSPDTGTFPLAPSDLAALAADGVVRVDLQNTPAVDASCSVNSHRVSLTYRGPAGLLDFGPIFLGASSRLTLEIRNTGNDILDIASVASDLREFSASPSAFSLAPRTSRTVAITFTPSAAAIFNAALAVASNDPDSPLVAIPMTGAGVEPPVIGVQPGSLASTLFAGGRQAQTLTISNGGGSPLDFSLSVRRRVSGAGDLAPASSCAATKAYVTEFRSGELSRVDLSSGGATVVASSLNRPNRGLAVSNDGSTAFVTESSSGEVSMVDITTGAVRHLAGGFEYPIGLVLNAAGDRAYVTDGGSSANSLVVIDLATGGVRTIAVGLGGPTGAALNQAETTLYVAEFSTDNIAAVDIRSGAVTRVASGLQGPGAVALNGPETIAYVVETISGELSAIDLATGAVTPIASGMNQPTGLALDADDATAFVAEYGGGRLLAIDLATGAATPIASDLASPAGVVLNVPPGCRGGFLRLDPLSGSVPPGGSMDVSAVFDAAGLNAGDYAADILVESSDPARPIVPVPALLTVIGAPAILVTGDRITFTSSRTYSDSGAWTYHNFIVTVPPAGDGTMDLVATGDYGDSSETATAWAEGKMIGTVGGTRVDCTSASSTFPVARADLAALVADGVVRVEVRSSPQVDAYCGTNAHVVRLNYRGASDRLDFGRLFVGVSRTLSITVENRGTDTLTVSSVASDLPEFAPSISSFSVAPRSLQRVSVTFTPSSASTFAGSLLIASDDPDSPLTSLPLLGTGLAPPIVGAEPFELRSTIWAGTRETQPLSISNAGGSPLDFSLHVRPVSASGTSGAALCLASKALVSEWGAGRLSRVDLPSGSATLVASGLSGPDNGLVMSRDGATAYVAESSSGEISAVDLATGAVRILTGGLVFPVGLALNAAGDTLFVTDARAGTLVAIDAATGGVRVIAVGLSAPSGLALDPYESTAYVAEFQGGRLSAVDLARGTIIPVVSWLDGPSGVALNRAGNTVYVTEMNAGEVSAFDLSTFTRKRVASGLTRPDGITLEPFRNLAYVTEQGSGRLSSVALLTGRVTVMASGLSGPTGVALELRPGCRGEFLRLDPASGSVPPSGSVSIRVEFDAARLIAGDYVADIAVASNDPAAPVLTVPAALTALGTPDISISGQPVFLQSEQSYLSAGALTSHEFSTFVPPEGGGAVTVITEGDFADPSETATVTAEGVLLGEVGGTGAGCSAASRTFTLPADLLAALTADGIVGIEVQNSAYVDASCPINRHAVRLAYQGSASRLDFGSLFVGHRRSISVIVANDGTDTLHVTSVASNTPEFAPSPSSFDLAPGSSRAVTVTFSPASAAGFLGALTIASDDPDRPQVLLPLTGTGVEPPIVGAQPAELRSTLMTGARETRALTITNGGGSPLHFTVRVLPDGAGGEALSSFAGAAGTLEALPASPLPLTCVVADAQQGILYGQATQGLAFFRYVASLNVWEGLPSAPITAASDCGAALLGGKIYASYVSGPGNLGVYDIAAGRWSILRDVPFAGTANIASDGSRFLYAVNGSTLAIFDPSTLATTILAPPPFSLGPFGALRHLDGVLYGHEGNGGTRFAAYDIAADQWRPLDPVPAGAVVGADIDPRRRAYFAYGPFGGRNLYRYDFDSGSWAAMTIPFFPVMDGGIGWLRTPFPAVYFTQGEAGTGFARLHTGAPLVQVTPSSGSVQPGGSFDLSVLFDATDPAPGVHTAAIGLSSNDPVTPLLKVPALLTVTAAPDIAISGRPVTLQSAMRYASHGAHTSHVLPVVVPPAGAGFLEVIAEGNYRSGSETATVTAEGRLLGSVGATGAECGTAGAAFTLPAADLTSLAADGSVRIDVRNSGDVGIFCPVNRHTVRLSYRGAADRLDFGSLFVHQSRALSLLVENNGTATLNVASITCDQPEFSASPSSFSLAPGSSFVVTATFAPSGPSPFSGALAFASDDPDTPVLRLPVTGVGVAPPVLDVQPSELRSSLPAGGSETQALTISNTGGSPLEFRLQVRDRGASRAGASPPGGCPPADALVTEWSSGTLLRVDLAGGAISILSGGLPGLNKGIALSGDGATAYVVQSTSGKVVAVDLATGAQRVVASGIASPIGLAASPSGDLLYVTASGTGELLSIDTATLAVRVVASGLSGPNDLATNAAGTFAIVTEYSLGRISIVNLLTGVITPLPAYLEGPESVALDPSETTAFVAEFDGGRISAIDLTTGEAMPLVSGLRGPSDLVLDARGDNAFVTEYGSGTLLVIDLASRLVTPVAAGLGNPAGVALLPGSCGPALLRLDIASGSVVAGGSVEVHALFDSTSLIGGDYSAEILVESNDPVRPVLTVPALLTVTGTPEIVVSGEPVTPQSSATYLAAGARTSHSLTLSSRPAGGGTFDLIANGDYESFTAKAAATAEGAPLGAVGAVGLRCSPASGSYPVGAADLAFLAADGVVSVEVVNAPGVDVSSCAVNSHTVRLTYNPVIERLDFGSLYVGASRTLVVNIENAGNDILHAASIAVDSPDLTVSPPSLAVPPGSSRRVTVIYMPTGAGALSATIRISSNDPDAPLVSLPVVGAALEPPSASVQPGRLDSVVTEGGQETQTLTIADGGVSPLRFSVAVRSGTAPPFISVMPSSGTVDPGGAVDVNVEFSAALLAPGNYAADIEVSTDDPLHPSFIIPVSLRVRGIPVIAVVGDPVTVESIKGYTTSGARTTHRLRLDSPGAGSATLELIAEGEFGVAGGIAAATIEGRSLGYVGGAGADCAPASGLFTIAAEEFADISADRIVQVVVQNSSQVDPACAVNRHTVRLQYRGLVETVDFGSVFAGGSRAAIIYVENNGTDDLEITSITSDLPEFSAAPSAMIVQKATVAALTLGFAPSSVGSFAGAIVITSNDPSTPEAYVGVTGEGAEPPVLGVQPLELRSTLREGEQETQALTVSNAGLSPLLFTASAQSIIGGSFVSVSPAAGTVPPSSTMPLSVLFDATGLPPGTYVASIAIASNDPRAPLTGIPAVLTVGGFPVIGITPADRLDFGSVFLGATATRSAVIENRGTETLVVDSIVSDSATFTPSTLSMTVPPGGTAPLSVTFAPAAEGPVTSALRIHSNDPATPEMVLSLLGAGAPPPIASVSPTSIELALPPAGRSSRTIRIYNGGRSDLTWSAHGSAAWIAPLPSSGAVPPGSFHDVALSIDAAGLPDGDHRAVVSVLSDDPAHGRIDVAILLHAGFTPLERLSVEPRTLNLTSSGRTIRVALQLPRTYDPRDVAIASVTINGTLHANASPVSFADENGDGVKELILKFDCGALEGMIPQGSAIPLTVTGEVRDRIWFTGMTTIRAIRPH